MNVFTTGATLLCLLHGQLVTVEGWHGEDRSKGHGGDSASGDPDLAKRCVEGGQIGRLEI